MAMATGLVAIDLGRSRLALGAEYLQIGLGLFSLSVPIDALETFAQTGESPEALDSYLDYLPPQARKQLQEVLTRQFQVSPVAVSQVTYSSLGEDFLRRLGQIVQTPSGFNGGQAIRASLILAASNPEGMSVMNILKAFPTAGIHINGGELLALQRELASYFSYRDAVLDAIREQANTEIAMTAEMVNWDEVPDLTNPGGFRFDKTTLRLRNQFAGIPTDAPRMFDVDLYTPQTDSTGRIPLVVISHGLGSSRSEFEKMAEHLASYGFAVAVPEHPGSNVKYQQEFLANLSYEGVDPFEFVYRPWDIKTLLNTLAAEPTYAQRFNLDKVGVIGHSFGGYTALALAGAELNLDRIRASCEPVEYVLNLSTLLQCRAMALPLADYDLRDTRVHAVMAYSPVTSLLLGPESMAKIDKPVMIVAGSSDFVAPVIPEQIHPFVWLESPEKYLATFIPASHVSINGEVDFPDQIDVAPRVSSLITGPDPKLSTAYAHALNAAFMGFYLGDRADYQTFLGAAYAAEFLSEPPIALQVISQLTAEQLQEAFGGAPPIPIYPEPLPKDSERSSEPAGGG
jgi:predicted dienelactone hydrolase